MDPIRVFSPDLVFLGEIDDYGSLIYTRKWSAHGEFQITIPEINPLLAAGNIIMLGTDPRKNGIIKYVQCSEQDGYITVKGYSLLWLLSGRVTVPPAGSSYFTATGSAEDIMLALVGQNAANPTDSKRKIPLLTCATSQGRGITMTWQSRYAGLLSDLTELARVSGLGIGIEIDYDTPAMVFRVYQGADRSASQSAVPPVLFSPDYDNLYQRVYTYNATESRNTAYVAGQGEGADRDVVIVGDENTGMDRMETFVDARDLEDASELPERGETKLASMQPVSSYTSSVIPRGYETDWDLGDIVTIQDREYGLQLDRRVDEVEESSDASRDLITPTFGAPEKTVADRLAETTGGGAMGESSAIYFTPGRVLVSDGDGMSMASSITSEELGCLDGASGPLQDQIDQIRDHYVHSAEGTGGTAGYIRIAEFQITSAYANSPFALEIASRGRGVLSTLFIAYNNLNGLTPTLYRFRYWGANCNAYMYNAGSGLWYLYVQKSESWDRIDVVDFWLPYYMRGKVSVTWTNVQASSVPSGAEVAVNALDLFGGAAASHTHSYVPLSGTTAMTGSIGYPRTTSNLTLSNRNAGSNNHAYNLIWGGSSSGGVFFLWDATSSRSIFGYDCNPESFYVNVETMRFGRGNARFSSAQNQQSYWWASNEAAYAVGLGVFSGMWRLQPNNNGQTSLGASGYRWNQIYSTTSSISTSDRNLKKDIHTLDEDTMRRFVLLLDPVGYKHIENAHGRRHFGLIAQQVEEAMTQVGLTDMDFAGFIRSPKTKPIYNEDGTLKDEEEIPGEYIYSLRYEEFIAPLISVVQHQAKQIEALEKRITDLEARLKD